jgi:exodeoxyribonuclease VII small subunit
MSTDPTAQGPEFEELYGALEDVARRLESGNLGLAESIALYERGAELVEQLRAILEAAEARVQQVRARLDSRSAGGLQGGAR